jgi:hypothetical protein
MVKSLDHLTWGDSRNGDASKFSQKRRELILVALAAGASRRTAAELAGISDRTWADGSSEASQPSRPARRHQFYLEVLEAEANPHHAPSATRRRDVGV